MNVIDAEFEVIEPKPFRIPWWSVLWFCVYALGFTLAAAQEPDPIARGAITFFATLLVPAARLYSWVAETVSEPEAQQLRQRLLARRGKARKRGLAVRPEENRVSRRRST